MESFRVEGLLASEQVYAEWDGSSVTASPDLLQLAELAVAGRRGLRRSGPGGGSLASWAPPGARAAPVGRHHLL
jgi:hypothetical protein